MRDFDSTKRAGPGKATTVFVWGGLLLLLAGGFLAYPYVSSRLVTFPATLVLTPQPLRPTVPPAPAGVPPTGISTLLHTSAPTLVPTPTSTPALPSRIVIPAIGVDAPVVPVSWHAVEVGGQAQTAWEVPDMYAAGWHETSAPLGEPGNTVLNGHNSAYGEVFRDLYTLEVGDVIAIYSGDTPYAYTVTDMLILPEAGQPLEVRVENAGYILPTEDERLTLVTCHPYGSLRNRLIVIARPVTLSEYGEGWR